MRGILSWISTGFSRAYLKEPNLLDYENISVLNFTIVAREANGNNPKESRANVQVHVRDVNDNTPDFSTSTYEAYVPENVEPGATIAWIRAEDEDSGILGTQGIRYCVFLQNINGKSVN